jgi:hypothetical protein
MTPSAYCLRELKGKFCCVIRMAAAPWVPDHNTVLTAKASP